MILTLIEAALRALLVAVTVWMGLRLLRVRNVPAQKVAWGLVLACAVAMPFLMRWQLLPQSFTLRLPAALLKNAPVALPSVRRAANATSFSPMVAIDATPRHRVAAEPLTGASRYPAPVITSGHLGEALDGPAADIADSSSAHAIVAADPEQVAGSSRWPRLHLPGIAVLATVLYAAVCFVLFIRIAVGLAIALRLWSAAQTFIARPFASGEPDPTHGLSIRFSRDVASPVTIGSGVLLPEECLAWNDEKLRIVLAHERAHVRQGDFYLQLAAGLYAAAFWFSPLGWWLKRILCDLGEAISDRAGLEQAASHTSYAQVLLEFAALPRPTSIGVAMARSNNLSQRIERLLNESSFRQAFAGSRRRILIALMLVPIALFTGTALIRVEAQAVPTPPLAPAPAAEPAPASGPTSAQQPAAVAAPAPVPDVMPPTPPPAPVVAEPGEDRDDADARAEAALAANAARAASAYISDSVSASVNLEEAHAYAQAAKAYGSGYSHGSSYSYSSNGDSYALVTEPGKHISFSGEWNEATRDTIDDARKLAHGKFLWFTHGGKSYLVDDPAIIAQLEAMYKPIEELSARQQALGKQQQELGRQQEELGRKQEQATVPAPDISKEMAELNASVARLSAKKDRGVSVEELSDLEGQISEIQGRIGGLVGKVGEKQGELGALQGKLGEQQGRLGEQQGALGEQQG